MPEREPQTSERIINAINSRISRKSFLKVVVIGVLGGGLAVACGVKDEQSASTEKFSQDLSRAAEEVKSFENAIGDKPLDFEKGREFLPLVAKLYIASTNSWQRPSDIGDHTFVLEGGYPELEAESVDLLFAELLENYPNIALDQDKIVQVGAAFLIRPALGITVDQDIFINLNESNKRVRRFSDERQEYPIFQFNEIAPTLICEPVKPVVRFRSVLLHELVHREVIRASKEISSDFRSSAEVILNIALGLDIDPSEIQGFRIKGTASTGENTSFVGLDEFSPSYIAARISSNNGLAYNFGHYRPVDFYNFAQILKQSNISDGELLSMFRESNLGEFLMTIGKTAKENEGEPSKVRPLDYGFALSAIIEAGEGGPINWEGYESIYPKIDPNTYEYDEGYTRIQAANGCIK